MSKEKLRKKILKLRKSKYNLKFKISMIKLINILKLNKFKKPVIGGYFPVNYEIDCLSLLNQFEKKNYKISLPVIKKKKNMKFYQWSFKEPLNINKYGIPEPYKTKALLPDVIFVPIVAFDKNKFRIGYGGGYYDRYLQKIEKKKKILSIGFAFSFQEINKVNRNKFDKKLDYILTNKSLI